MRSLIIALTFFLLSLSNAFALDYIEKDGIYLYYPKGEGELANRMADKLPSSITFLEQMGIEIKRPTHVILDHEMDRANVKVHMIPHREIRIPLRAPGVFEEGYTRADPWSYFLFKGLCRQGLYSMRSKIPRLLHIAFGELISPNIVIPQWLRDGICALLYDLHQKEKSHDPFNDAVFRSSSPPDMDKLSNHPGIWPGFFSYRIYGRPFIFYLYEQYGWDALLQFFKLHGGGIMPVEIDLKAKKIFNKTWPSLWDDFKKTLQPHENKNNNTVISGYWPDPFIYWNVSGIFPGIEKSRIRNRYGYKDKNNILWISEYNGNGSSQIVGYKSGVSIPFDVDHIWDPGKGDVAVTRKGHAPFLALFKRENNHLIRSGDIQVIPGPRGAIQMSGPVRNKNKIAVSAHVRGNWDIWVYDDKWQKKTSSPAIEMDPFWDGDNLIFSSNATGTFQIYMNNMVQLTEEKYGAILPRAGRYIAISENDCAIKEYTLKDQPPVDNNEGTDLTYSKTMEELENGNSYSPFKSLCPNFMAPDLYISEFDIQFGAFTHSRDVTRDFKTNAGFRYSVDLSYLSLRAGATIKDVSIQASRYPLSYVTTLETFTDESRQELRLAWNPFGIDWMALSLNRLDFEDLGGAWKGYHDTWAGLHLNKQYGDLYSWGTFEQYEEGMSSLFGGFYFFMGSQIYSSIQVQGGKTWQDYVPGHGSFRIGGNIEEGFFTKRPSRLFPLRGFDSNILEAGSAVTSKIEIYWPLFNIQKGYKTIPLFLHRLRLGTFIDAGACSDNMSMEDLLVGAGVEFIMSMEVAWGVFSRFRMGMAWPVHQPEYMDETGPILIMQIGRPL